VEYKEHLPLNEYKVLVFSFLRAYFFASFDDGTSKGGDLKAYIPCKETSVLND
jgi:hypothetical protein